MGVLGLAPFLHKKAPQVFKEIPNRLGGLKGKTVVIDATLITQRLHYSPAPHEFRHVLGWYRIIRQLQRSGVGVICVFDGPQRALAKMREHERRKASRVLTIARESIEVERLARLEQLGKLLESFEALPDSTRQSALKQLKLDVPKVQDNVDVAAEDIVEEVEIVVETQVDAEPLPQLQPSDTVEAADPELESKPRPPDTAFRIPYRKPVIVHRWVSPYGSLVSSPDSSEEQTVAPASATTTVSDVPSVGPPSTEASVTTAKPTPASTSIDPQTAESYDVVVAPEDIQSITDAAVLAGPTDHILDVSVEEHSQTETLYWGFEDLGLREDEIQTLVTTLETNRASEPSPIPADETTVVRALASLYNDYRHSVPKFRVPAQVERKQISERPEDAATASASAEEISEHAMSIFQYELMLKEGALWNAVAASDASNTAHALHVRSAAIAASYAKRNDFPTERTYSESKSILRALGVPCLSCDGPHEGEAFASALVHAGVADYVASEDTDVLVYEATLLRGLTNIRAPLIAVSGAEVRAALGLDRAAYVDFALLLGTDFSRRLYKLGPVRALALLRKHGSIENVLDSGAAQPEDREEYMHQIQLARAVFNSLPEVSQRDIQAAVPSSPNFTLVRELLSAFDLERAARDADAEDMPAERHGFGQDFWADGGTGDRANDIGTAFFSDDPNSSLQSTSLLNHP